MANRIFSDFEMSQTRQGLKEHSRNGRDQRFKELTSLRNSSRDNFIQKLRQSLDLLKSLIPRHQLTLDSGEPWTQTVLSTMSDTQHEMEELLGTSSHQLLVRTLSALIGIEESSDPQPYFALTINSVPDFLNFIASCLHPNSIDFHFALEICLRLANSQHSVKISLIDSGITTAFYQLAELLDYSDLQIAIRPIAFFYRLISSNEDLFRTLGINLGLPSQCIQILGRLLEFQTRVGAEELALLCSLLLGALTKIHDAWDYHLEQYGEIWIQVIRNCPSLNVVTNLIFALADIASFVDSHAMHRLVPLFSETGLLETIVTSKSQEREIVGHITLCRLFCSTDEILMGHLLCNKDIMSFMQSGIGHVDPKIRMYAFNSLANIFSAKDKTIHSNLYKDSQCHYFAKLVAVINNDSDDVRRVAFFAVSNILNWGEEEHRDWFANQPMFLEPLLDKLQSTTNTNMLEDIFDILEQLLSHEKENTTHPMWKIFKQKDLEGKLNEIMFDCRGSISQSAEQLLLDHFDYCPVDEDDLDIEYEGSSDEMSIVRHYRPTEGQTNIKEWLTSSPGYFPQTMELS